eukprot:jgi/Hompol1/5853/HPOL_001024-RA
MNMQRRRVSDAAWLEDDQLSQHDLAKSKALFGDVDDTNTFSAQLDMPDLMSVRPTSVFDDIKSPFGNSGPLHGLDETSAVDEMSQGHVSMDIASEISTDGHLDSYDVSMQFSPSQNRTGAQTVVEDSADSTSAVDSSLSDMDMSQTVARHDTASNSLYAEKMAILDAIVSACPNTKASCIIGFFIRLSCYFCNAYIWVSAECASHEK